MIKTPIVDKGRNASDDGQASVAKTAAPPPADRPDLFEQFLDLGDIDFEAWPHRG